MIEVNEPDFCKNNLINDNPISDMDTSITRKVLRKCFPNLRILQYFSNIFKSSILQNGILFGQALKIFVERFERCSMNSSAFLKRFPRPARSSASPFKVLATMRSSSSMDLYFVSGFLTVFAIIYDRQICTWTLCFKDFCRLVYPASLLHNPYFFLRLSVQPGPHRSARPWPRCVAPAPSSREALSPLELFMQGERLDPPGGPCDRSGRHRRGRRNRWCGSEKNSA